MILENEIYREYLRLAKDCKKVVEDIFRKPENRMKELVKPFDFFVYLNLKIFFLLLFSIISRPINL